MQEKVTPFVWHRISDDVQQMRITDGTLYIVTNVVKAVADGDVPLPWPTDRYWHSPILVSDRPSMAPIAAQVASQVDDLTRAALADLRKKVTALGLRVAELSLDHRVQVESLDSVKDRLDRRIVRIHVPAPIRRVVDSLAARVRRARGH